MGTHFRLFTGLGEYCPKKLKPEPICMEKIMDCPKGSILRESEHDVKTIKSAKEWFSDIEEDQMPIKVRQYTAKNGRCMIKVFDNKNKLVHQRG